MFRKIYTLLLRLYPSKFRKAYEDEALQLIQDRLRAETGFYKRARLLLDLVVDLLSGLPQAHSNSYAAAEAASLTLHADGIPSFRVLEEEPIGRGSILLGGTLSFVSIVAFGFLMSRSIGRLPALGWQGRMSPIEAVVERLNRAADAGSSDSRNAPTDTPRTVPDRPSPFNSVGASKPQPGTRLPAAASSPDSHATAFVHESRKLVSRQDQTISMLTKNPDERSLYLPPGETTAWNGTLTDAHGRPVSAAEIHVIGGHGERVVRTAADGSFAFSDLPSGDYEVAVVSNGREIAYRKALHLGSGSPPSRLTLASGGRLLASSR